MAEEQEADEQKPGMMDGAMLNQVITMYLYGHYMFKKGRLSPPEAMDKVMKLAQVMEKAGTVGQKIKDQLSAYRKKSG